VVLEDPTIGEPGMEGFAGDMSCGHTIMMDRRVKDYVGNMFFCDVEKKLNC